MSITRTQFNILVHLTENKEACPNCVASALNVEKQEVLALMEQGLISENLEVTKEGLEALEPYRAKRVIFLAAGFGTRLRPATLNIPKPLVRVFGEHIICYAINAALKIGIEEIVIVTGYLNDMFYTIKRRYPQVTLVHNPEYGLSNNISSAMRVLDKLSNAYIMEADLLIKNPKVFRKYNYTSNCVGVPVQKTFDWCVISENGVAKELKKGGENCHHLYSIYYFTEEEGKILPEDITAVYNMREGKSCFWDMTPMNYFNDHYHIEIVECGHTDIVEIDTYDELCAIDDAYEHYN